jgi:hypothetical protein
MQTQEFNYVVGFVANTKGEPVSGFAVMTPDKKTKLIVDHSQPITLARCKEILAKAKEVSGRDLIYIKINLSKFTKTPGNECADFAEQCLFDKSYHYDSRNNSLMIYKNGDPVYANDNGTICKDQAALFDSM